MEYQNFCYRYVAQPSLYKRDEFCLRFLLAFFAKLKKNHQNTDGYQVFFIRLSPLYVAFHSKNASLKNNVDFLEIPEICDICLKT